MNSAPYSVQIYVRFHRDIYECIQTLAVRSGRRRATTAAWILTRAAALAVAEHPDYRVTPQDFGFDGTEDTYFLHNGRQAGAKAGPPMILTLNKKIHRDLELLAAQLDMPVSHFRTAVLACYFTQGGLL